ncbi:hypothetical protein HanXRQr2_Chr16g0749281 [Helianthus annuus]|uniref:Uncharacterized protein n=1 Tax=Helianthus annuus TaxID=4232 RepID=A0A9K3DT89_HELAN|nr:hypothetical protein HanXRQr2_Chr16g0749281 [Helianthus annuus]KAJ0821282.1 hypothetical protein HanPSC8_Chr16g0718211 [Helianthus annuus]
MFISFNRTLYLHGVRIQHNYSCFKILSISLSFLKKPRSYSWSYICPRVFTSSYIYRFCFFQRCIRVSQIDAVR